MPSTIEIRRADLHDARVTEADPTPLAPGQARLAVDAFGLTANNVTYAVYGDRMSYWSFFPAPSGPDWGVVPVWGFADVADSTIDGLDVGERFYGYLPMGDELIVEPAKVGASGFTDDSPHRRDLPAVYNRYTRCSTDPTYDPALEDAQMLLRPLFFTSWLLADYLAANDFFDATQIVATSASSKTAFGTAFALERAVSVAGLTSARNVDFVKSLGCYDMVFDYEHIESLPDQPTVLIDFSGNLGVVRRVHERLGDRLRRSLVIGGTHWDSDRSPGEGLPGPQREFFFAPAQVERRTAEWGGAELMQRIGEAWNRFVPAAEEWLTVERVSGLDSAVAVYADLLAGRADPAVAHVIDV